MGIFNDLIGNRKVEGSVCFISSEAEESLKILHIPNRGSSFGHHLLVTDLEENLLYITWY